MKQSKGVLLSDIILMSILALFSLVYIILITSTTLYSVETITKIFMVVLFSGAYTYVITKGNLLDFLLLLGAILLFFFSFYLLVYNDSIISFYFLFAFLSIVTIMISFEDSLFSLLIVISIEIIIIFSIGDLFKYDALMKLSDQLQEYILIDIRYFIILITVFAFLLKAIFLSILEGNPQIKSYIILDKRYNDSSEGIFFVAVKPFKIIARVIINLIVVLINFLLIFLHKLFIYLYRVGKNLLLGLVESFWSESLYFFLRVFIPYSSIIILYLYLIDIFYEDILIYVQNSLSSLNFKNLLWMLLNIIFFFLISLAMLNVSLFVVDDEITSTEYETTIFVATVYILIFYSVSLVLYFFVFTLNINIMGFNEFGLFSSFITMIILIFFIKELFSL